MLGRLGNVIQAHGMKRVLIVSDPGVAKAGITARAVKMLWDLKIETFVFQDFGPNPDTDMVRRGHDYAWPLMIDSIVGLGGGSSMDMAKAINFLLTNGGEMKDYKGHGKATRPMYPMIGIPTTAGTGSEAQSYCIISDAETHMKMACGDAGAAFRVAILDPELTLTQPASVTAAAGYDALSHAVESFVTTKRTPWSQMLAREAFRLLDGNLEKVVKEPSNMEARGAMMLGAHFAGMAIEGSMLGATHACANPLTAHYGVAHGEAIAVLLQHVVRWNRLHKEYLQLRAYLPERLRDLAKAAGLPGSLQEAGVKDQTLFETMAAEATEQWTGKHNPRALDHAGAMEIYQCAY
ncbi:iron alcohol dehydrogenase [Bryobacterales bacterium F-183]|nr:iron alcohol dehydrogenase [Bryobacterales bacterium F-183]